MTATLGLDGGISLSDLIGPGITHAPCRGHDEVMFSDEPDEVEQAKAICATCPEQKFLHCLEYSLDNQEPAGTWGGVSAAERVDLIAYQKQLRSG